MSRTPLPQSSISLDRVHKVGSTDSDIHSNSNGMDGDDAMAAVDDIGWGIINQHFTDNPAWLVAHHLDSYNDFFNEGIFQIFRENNPVRFIERGEDLTRASKTKAGTGTGLGATQARPEKNAELRRQCFLYFGGKSGTRIYFGKPMIYDESTGEQTQRYMYPNSARLLNLTYGIAIHYDVEVEVHTYNAAGDPQISEFVLDRIFLGRFPLMLNSQLCILNGLSAEARFNLGECRNDHGGYFIIDGKEKCIVSQEKFGDNMLYVRKHPPDDSYLFSSEVRSVSEDSSKPIRYTSVRLLQPLARNTHCKLIVVDVPNVSKPVPLCILMRALGVLSDRDIIEHCILDMETFSSMVDLFEPSIADAGRIFTQEAAIEYMKTFTKRNTITGVLSILTDYLLPHVGGRNFADKAYYIGYMVKELLNVAEGYSNPIDRDSFRYKRVEVSGTLIYDLFRDFYLIQKRSFWLKMDKEFYYHKTKYEANLDQLVQLNYVDFFAERVVEEGLRKAFKGSWGTTPETMREGVIQSLNRLSWFTAASHLRKINLAGSGLKTAPPHYLHGSQWNTIDPVDTPDGEHVGLHKHMAITTTITTRYSMQGLLQWIRAEYPLMGLHDCPTNVIATGAKVFINGSWVGVVMNPLEMVDHLRLCRRNGIIPVYTSITFNYKRATIELFTDGGRLTRPIYYTSHLPTQTHQKDTRTLRQVSYLRKPYANMLLQGKVSWVNIIAGFGDKYRGDPTFQVRNNTVYSISRLYPDLAYTTPEDRATTRATLYQTRAMVDYMDASEAENAFIAINAEAFQTNRRYTHQDIHPSLMFGIMGNSIVFPEFNQLPRDVFSCGQSKQAVSIYHGNYRMRMDKMGVVLNYGQVPVIKTRYLQYINQEQHPYGVNAIVAIMAYTGYNVEDAVLINRGSVERGIFQTTYFTAYEAREESSRVKGSQSVSAFANVYNHDGITRLKEGYDYSYLDDHGLIRENTDIHDRVILIGKVSAAVGAPGNGNGNGNGEPSGDMFDQSTTTKKGQLGVVDKAFMSEGEEGFRIAKVRVREQRIPAIGDKIGSRVGQKGTIGLIVNEEDMPFTKDGVRPDLIINPHALPSRMTIGQLIETLFGKTCVEYGGFGDCTAFVSKGSNYRTCGELLTRAGLHKSGDEVLYSGFTGAALEANIFIGPTYYMRLKHMVKDKINYRATGKRSQLTRQTNQGRANDGGLRVGEMERDGMLGNGMSGMLEDSFMVRGDEHFMAICNKTGIIAIYNPSKKIFLSPAADGPLTFTTTDQGDLVMNSVSKHGRTFSIVRVPYSLKLLVQEVQVMGIQMRLITSDNINQLMPLTYKSNNLNKLLHITDRVEIEQIVQTYTAQLDTIVRDLAVTQMRANTVSIPSNEVLYPELEHGSDDLSEPDKYIPIALPTAAPEGEGEGEFEGEVEGEGEGEFEGEGEVEGQGVNNTNAVDVIAAANMNMNMNMNMNADANIRGDSNSSSVEFAPDSPSYMPDNVMPNNVMPNNVNRNTRVHITIPETTADRVYAGPRAVFEPTTPESGAEPGSESDRSMMGGNANTGNANTGNDTMDDTATKKIIHIGS